MGGPYSSEATARCERALCTLMRAIGQPWRRRVCLVGGLVPQYLVPQGGYLQPVHVGSTDVDVALRLAVDADDCAAYRTLQTNLKASGFKRVNRSSWRWFVEVEGEVVILELLGDNKDAEPGVVFRPRVTPPAGAGDVGVLCVRGVELAFRDAINVKRDVRLLDGSSTHVEFQVVNLAPYLALKADAYLDRRKPKDAYDFVYVLRWWPGGPDAAAKVVASSPVAHEKFVLHGLSRVWSDFTSQDRVGPADYAALAAEGGTAHRQALARNEAVLVTRRFYDALAKLGFPLKGAEG